MKYLASLFLVWVSCLLARADVVPVQTGTGNINAFVGGRVSNYAATINYTNCCAGGTLTNLASSSFPANGLANSGDTISFTAVGKFSLTGQSKRIVVTYGSQDLLDTGLQAVSNGTWVVQGSVTRWGAAQYYWARLSWNRAVAGGGTNVSGWIAQTNDTATLLRIQGAANVVSSITNECLFVDWQPGPR